MIAESNIYFRWYLAIDSLAVEGERCWSSFQPSPASVVQSSLSLPAERQGTEFSVGRAGKMIGREE